MADLSPTAAVRSLRASLVRFGVPLVWIVMPFVAGAALADALDPRSRPVQVVASTGLWVAWTAALVAMLVPRTVSLTAIRIIVPGSMAAALASAVTSPSFGVAHIVALGATTVATVLVLAPFTGDLMVNGSSYGDERRFALRAPAGLMLGPIELAWVVCVAGAAAGPLLLAAQAWAVGALVLAVGWPASFFAARALHGLAKRWIVFVPVGFVLHDQMALTDPMLVPRKLVGSLGPALADTVATDFTLGSMGLALQADLNEPVAVTPIGKGTTPVQRPAVEPIEVTAILFTPTRPGAVLAEARARRLPVG